MKKDYSSIAPISKNEMGQLKGGFSVFSAEHRNPIQGTVSVTVHGNCGCSCEATEPIK